MSADRSILITGATGLLGRDVLARLLAADSRLRAFVLVRDLGRWLQTAPRACPPESRHPGVRRSLRRRAWFDARRARRDSPRHNGDRSSRRRHDLLLATRSRPRREHARYPARVGAC